jgi:hypothetical protein
MTSKTLKTSKSMPGLANGEREEKAERAGREFVCKECDQKITETQSILSKVRISGAFHGALCSSS